MIFSNIVPLLALSAASLVECNPAAEIKDLPGLHVDYKLNFKQYSGFLKGSERSFLHYWLTEAEADAAVNPLVIWLNGGPGASSVGGLLDELGPFFINDDGLTLRRNPHAWNTAANLLFVESPAGVGYSYSTDFNVTTNDDETSLVNYNALKDFFGQFPQYRRHDLYITGESYAGKYIPTLVSRILDGMDDFAINLKGMAIGNGALHDQWQADGAVTFGYARGFVDQKNAFARLLIWELMRESCCESSCGTSCAFTAAKGAFCKFNVAKIHELLWSEDINPYDVYRDCYLDWKGRASLIRRMAPPSVRAKLEERKELYNTNQYGGHNLPCMDASMKERYMNQPSVRQALHIPDHIHDWAYDTTAVSTTYKQQYTDMSAFVVRAVKSGLRVMLYYGDTDVVCNHVMGQRFAASLGLPLKQAKRPWHFDEQIVGYVTEYQGGLEYLTVKGAGHMVPQWKPAASKHMITRYLNNQPY